MLTKEDYISYFEQIARVERKMIYGCCDLASRLSEPKFVRILQRIRDDEVRHYSYVLDLLLPLVSGPGYPENRNGLGEYPVATVSLRSLEDENGRELGGWCVRFSEKGICIESPEEILPGGVWEVKVSFLDKGEALVRRGEMVWAKKVEPDLYMAGINFRD